MLVVWSSQSKLSQVQYLSAIGCRACEASLSNILCSGGCSGWSSSPRAWLQRCNSRWWRQASHNTCWFLSLFTRSWRMLATASCKSRACCRQKTELCFCLVSYQDIYLPRCINPLDPCLARGSTFASGVSSPLAGCQTRRRAAGPVWPGQPLGEWRPCQTKMRRKRGGKDWPGEASGLWGLWLVQAGPTSHSNHVWEAKWDSVQCSSTHHTQQKTGVRILNEYKVKRLRRFF